MARLTGKVAWITGAGTGVGRATALALSREGATVVILGRQQDSLGDTAAEVTAAGGTAHVQEADVRDAEAMRRCGASIEEMFGRLDILVNNAAVNVTERQWHRLTFENAEQLLTTNLVGAFNVALSALPAMRRRKDGVIINVASIAAHFVGGPSGPAYISSKSGMVAMSHTINQEEFVNGIRSCVICPGEVATPMLQKRPIPLTDDERAIILQPEDCADLIAYVACLPKRVCLSMALITPTWNRAHVNALRAQGVAVDPAGLGLAEGAP